MRRLRWITPLLVLAFAACADTGDEAGEGEPPVAGERTVQAVPGCEPAIEQMPLEGRPSPYDSTTIDVGSGAAKICYGRPSLKGRTMIGGEAVPYDTLWRTGANEPTTIHLNVPASIAGLDVEPGDYSLYTIPHEAGPWTLIVNRSTSQWGHESQYTPEVRAQEVGRVDVEVETLDAPVEQLAIRPAEAGESGVVLEWQDSRVKIPIEPAG